MRVMMVVVMVLSQHEKVGYARSGCGVNSEKWMELIGFLDSIQHSAVGIQPGECSVGLRRNLVEPLLAPNSGRRNVGFS
jgi:hypothetical protein